MMIDASDKFVIRINKSNTLKIEDIAFVLFFSGSAIEYFFSRFARLVGLGSFSDYIVQFVYAITAICIVVGVLRMNNLGVRRKGLLLLSVVALVFLFSYLLNPEIGSWLLDDTYGLGSVFGLNGEIFGAGIFAFFVIAIQRDTDHIIRNLKICSAILTIYLLIMAYNRIRLGYFPVVVEGSRIQKAYNMSFGYYSAFICTFNIFLWRRDKKIFRLMLAIFFGLASIVFGSRGAILIYALFAAALIWTSLKSAKSSRRILIIVAIFALAISLTRFFTEIMMLLQNVLSSLGITNSRTLTGLLSGELSDANGRDQLWSIVSEMIKSKFPFGYGVFGERVTVGHTFRWGYSHNIFLEILVAFGIIGLILEIYMVVKSFSLINNDTNKDLNMLFILFFSQCGMLLVSNSFWYHPYFWATIAIGMVYSQEIKKPNLLPKQGNM